MQKYGDVSDAAARANFLQFCKILWFHEFFLTTLHIFAKFLAISCFFFAHFAYFAGFLRIFCTHFVC